MADMLKAGSDWLLDQQKEHASQTVTYTRGADSASVSAVVGRTSRDTLDNDGIITQITTRDFIIQVADLVINAVTIEPAEQDRIAEGGETFEVMRISGQSAARHADLHRKAWRIHTKQVA